MSCEFCLGEMEYATPYARLYRRKETKPFPEYTVELTLSVCPQHAECSAKEMILDRKTQFDFDYCPKCGARLIEERKKNEQTD